MTTKEILQKKFDIEDAYAALEILEMWKEKPQELIDIFVSGMMTLDHKEARDGLVEFSNIFNKVSGALCDTEDGKHFHCLFCIIKQYIALLDYFHKEKPDNILN